VDHLDAVESADGPPDCACGQRSCCRVDI